MAELDKKKRKKAYAAEKRTACFCRCDDVSCVPECVRRRDSSNQSIVQTPRESQGRRMCRTYNSNRWDHFYLGFRYTNMGDNSVGLGLVRVYSACSVLCRLVVILRTVLLHI